MTITSHRTVRLSAAAPPAAALRTGVYDAREHLIFPLVALLGDSVIEATGSRGPEFVPAEELAAQPGGWNDRPLVPDHPAEGSATQRDVLERMLVGRVFEARYEDGALRMEAWLDTERAARAEGGPALLEALRSGDEVLEVSVGCFIREDETPGVSPSGKRYVLAWRNIVPDHVAVGLAGKTGACSVEMGCGARRAVADRLAIRQRLRAAVEVAAMTDRKDPGAAPSLVRRALDALFRVAEPDPGGGATDMELRERLWKALRALEPGFDYVESYTPDTRTVIYAVSPDGEPILYGRTYTVADDGEVALNDDRQEFEQTIEYRPVAAAAASSADEPEVSTVNPATVDCGCSSKGEGRAAADQPTTSTVSKEASMENVQKLVGRLMASPQFPTELKCEAALTAYGEDRLVALAGKFAPEDAPPVAPAPTPPARTAELTPEAWLAAAPKEFRDAVERDQRREVSRRAELVGRLRDAQKVYSEAELTAMPTEQLERTASLLEAAAPADPADFIGAGAPLNTTEAHRAATKAPNAWGIEFVGGVSREQKGAN